MPLPTEKYQPSEEDPSFISAQQRIDNRKFLFDTKNIEEEDQKKIDSGDALRCPDDGEGGLYSDWDSCTEVCLGAGCKNLKLCWNTKTKKTHDFEEKQ